MALWAQEKPTYQVGMLIDLVVPELNPLLDELKEEITAVVGEDAIIEFPEQLILVNELNIEKAQQNYEDLINSEADLILAFGLVNNAIITQKNTFPKPTILFGAVNKDFENLDLELAEQGSGVENFSFLISSRSYKKDIATFYELTGFNNLAIAIQKPFIEVYPYQEFFEKEFEKFDAEFTLISYENYEDIARSLDQFDALYLAEGFYLSRADIAKLAEDCISLRIPSFSGMSIDDVQGGMLATIQSEDNLSQLFRRLALYVEAIVQGDRLSELPVYIGFDERLTLNYNTAERIGLPLKYSLIAVTDFIGDFDKKMSDKKYDLLEVMNQVLGDNLQLQALQKDVELSEKEVQSAWTS